MSRSNNPRKDPARWIKQRAYTAGYDDGYKTAVWFVELPAYTVPDIYKNYPNEWITGFTIGFATRRRKLESVRERD